MGKKLVNLTKDKKEKPPENGENRDHKIKW